MTQPITTLKDIPYQSVSRVTPDTPLSEAVRDMDANGAERVMVIQGHTLLGMLTTRDRLSALRRRLPPGTPVRAVMSRVRGTLSQSLSIDDACNQVLDSEAGDLIVSDDLGRPLGLLDEAELLRRAVPPLHETEVNTKPPVPLSDEHGDKQQRTWFQSVRAPILSAVDTLRRTVGVAPEGAGQSETDRQFRTRKSQTELLSRFATTLINLPANSSDAAVNHALMQMGELAQVDRAYIFRYDFDANIACNTHEWCAPGISPQKDNLQALTLTTVRDWVESHQREESLVVNDVDALPPGAVRDILEPQDIKSLVSLPIMGRDGCFGFLGFDSVRSKRAYGPEDLDILGLFAKTLANYQERVNAEQKLANNEANFQAFFNQTQDLLFVLSHEGDIVQFNTHAARRLGFTAEHLCGKSVLQLHAPEYHEELVRTIKSMADGNMDHHSIPMQTRSGQRVSVETHVVAGQWNALPALFMVCRDVSDITASEEKFSKAFHLSPMPMVIADLQLGTFLEVNEAFVQITGYDLRETIGNDVTTLGLFDNPGQWELITRQLQQAGQVDTVEALLRTRQGSLVSGLLNAAVLELQGRHLMIYQMLDITARKAAENALENEKIQLRSLINSQPNLFWLKDPDGVYLTCNALFESLYGLPESDIIGKTDHDFVDEEQAEFFRKHDRLAIKSGTTCVNEENLTFASTGYQGLFETTKTPIYNANDKLIGVLGISRDITRARQAEQERQRIEREMHQSQKMEALGQLSGGVAHEFNNMLAIILGYKDLVQNRLEPDADPVLHAWLEHIDVAGVRAKELVLQLLSFSQPSEARSRRMNLAAGVGNAIVLSQGSLPSSIDINYRPAAFLPDVQLDPGELQQMLTNLLVNARDAMDGQGSIEVSLQMTRLDDQECQVCHSLVAGDWVELCIADTGSGIQLGADPLSRIFEPFYTTKSVGKGTGLGLSMVGSTVESRGGHILLETRVSEGTRFRLLFPPLAFETGEKAPNQQRLDTPSLHGGRALVVDDEPALSEFLKEALERQGLQVVALTDSREALALLNESEQHFDLLITDQTMPGMLGTELAMQAKTQRRDLKVILCTGHSEQVNAGNAAEFGIDGYLEKPVGIQDIVITIDRLSK